MDEPAPYFHHVDDTCGRWHAEEAASTGVDDDTLLEPMSHMVMLPPDLPPREFVPYAQVFADEVLPAFRA